MYLKLCQNTYVKDKFYAATKIGLNVQIYVTTNISVFIFVSTCKQLNQSEPMEF